MVEQAAIAGALNPDIFNDLGRANAMAEAIARRLDAIAEDTERGWSGRTSTSNEGGPGGYVFERTVRGVKEYAQPRHGTAQARPTPARSTATPAASAQSIRLSPVLRRKELSEPLSGPLALLEAVFATGRKGLTMQRYKGLGEMNAEQLWETTLDPNVRSLLQVKVNDATDADMLFSRLMGDEVEPRREFIQENALNVANLDV